MNVEDSSVKRTVQRRHSFSILITDGHALAALGAVRSLGRAGHHVVVARGSEIRVAKATWSRYSSGQVQHPNPAYQPERFRDWLLAQARGGGYDAILPISEAAIVAAASERAELSRHARQLIPTATGMRYTLSKYEATRLALASGVPVPATVFVRGPDAPPDAVDRISELRFPIVLKTDNHIGADGRYIIGETAVVKAPGGVAPILARLEMVPTSIIAQEHVGRHGVGAFLLRHDG